MPKLTDDEIVEMMSTGSVTRGPFKAADIWDAQNYGKSTGKYERGPFSSGLTDFGLRQTALSQLTAAEHLQLAPMIEKLAAKMIARRKPPA